jgi:hypothetical protein
MWPRKRLSFGDVVLEVEPTGGSLEATGAAARNDRVLAASTNTTASRSVLCCMVLLSQVDASRRLRSEKN